MPDSIRKGSATKYNQLKTSQQLIVITYIKIFRVDLACRFTKTAKSDWVPSGRFTDRSRLRRCHLSLF